MPNHYLPRIDLSRAGRLQSGRELHCSATATSSEAYPYGNAQTKTPGGPLRTGAAARGALDRGLLRILDRRVPVGGQHDRRLSPRHSAFPGLAGGTHRPLADDRGPLRLRRLAPCATAGTRQYCTSHRGPADVLSISAAGRHSAGEPGGTVGQPEAVATDSAGPVAHDGHPVPRRHPTATTHSGGGTERCSNCSMPPAAAPPKSRI